MAGIDRQAGANYLAPMPELSEFSRRIPVDRIGSKPSVHEITATRDECAALAKRFDLLSLQDLAGVVTLERVDAGRSVRLTAQFRANVVQSCVVTLEPVAAEVADAFAMVYAPGKGSANAVDIDPDPQAAAIEPLPAEAIDIGEAVAQQLALSIDPYPRAPRARLDAVWRGTEAGEAVAKRPSGPFAALAALKARPKAGRS